MTIEYLDLLNAVENYYGTGSDQWAQIAKYGINAAEAETILKQVPNVNIVKNVDGSIRSFEVIKEVSTSQTIASEINSNAITTTKTDVRLPAQMSVNSETGKLAAETGVGTLATMTTYSFVDFTLVPALVAAGTGIALGKTIDSVLYNANPEFWDSNDMAEINPETWDTITSGIEDEPLARVFNGIFGLGKPNGATPSDKSQAYIDQNAFAYMAKYLQSKGVFNDGDYSSEKTIDGTNYTLVYRPLDGTIWESDGLTSSIISSSGLTEPYAIQLKSGNGYSGDALVISKTPGSFVRRTVYPSGYTEDTTWNVSSSYGNYYSGGGLYTYNTRTPYPESTNIPYNSDSPLLNDYAGITRACKVVYEGTQSGGSTIEGIGTQEGATTPSFDPDDTVEQVLTKLQEQYPEIFDGAVTQDVVQPDGTIKEYTYIPFPLPQPNPTPTDNAEPDDQPISAGGTQEDPEVDPEVDPESVPELVVTSTSIPDDPNPDPTGEGETPAVIAPTGSAEALYRVWNPTEAQLNQFGGWLWSSNFVDQLLKVFNDPMQAIIGLHKVFVTPSVGGTDTITVGYLDSGVSSNYIDEQYTTVDCGTVSLIEQYQNVFDYSPFTDVTLYLPFIGFVRLDVSDVMRSTINVKYHVDVLTGACLAEVKVIRDMYGGVLYTYSGNCSVTYPLSSGSYMGIVGTIASIAGGIAGTLATGGAAAPMVLGAAAGAMNAHTNIERSGSLSGNSGAMGIKKPYLVISRPQTNLASDFETFIGKPANYTTTLSSASGFVSCTEVHLINCNATDSEIAEIESLLRSGIII